MFPCKFLCEFSWSNHFILECRQNTPDLWSNESFVKWHLVTWFCCNQDITLSQSTDSSVRILSDTFSNGCERGDTSFLVRPLARYPPHRFGTVVGQVNHPWGGILHFLFQICNFILSSSGIIATILYTSEHIGIHHASFAQFHLRERIYSGPGL